jgi:hypothetical protein
MSFSRPGLVVSKMILLPSVAGQITEVPVRGVSEGKGATLLQIMTSEQSEE